MGLVVKGVGVDLKLVSQRQTVRVEEPGVDAETMIVRGVAVENQRFYIPFEVRTQADGSVKFFFDPDDYPSLADPAMIIMPWSSDSSPFFISDQQIETALLTTSAFPTGFGRKRLQYCRQKKPSQRLR